MTDSDATDEAMADGTMTGKMPDDTATDNASTEGANDDIVEIDAINQDMIRKLRQKLGNCSTQHV